MRLFFIFVFILLFTNIHAQSVSAKKNGNVVSRPKLVVGIVIDQMRWDYLYRYYERYSPNGAFKRMLNEGFSFDQTMIPYMPTITGSGHASIYTGTVPAINGIVGNHWPDRKDGKMIYCTEDKNVRSVGTSSSAGQMSPRNMLTTSVCDELKLATNFKSRVIGVSLKDRGSIFPAGHSADAAYWYEPKSGNWISSSHYLNDLPNWVNVFNSKKMADKYYQSGWHTLYNIQTYQQSTLDNKDYAGSPFGKEQQSFPYELKKFTGKDYEAIIKTPYGNSITISFAKEAITNEKLGADEITDFLAISFSSPDYIGHAFGPNSIEVEDNYLRLDQELGDFFEFLDARIGKGNYLSFLTSDHGVAHVPAFLEEHKIPGGVMDINNLTDSLNQNIKNKFGSERLIQDIHNYQIFLNHKVVDSLSISQSDLITEIMYLLKKEKSIDRVIEFDEIMETPLPHYIREHIVNGYYPQRCGDIQIILKPAWVDVGKKGTSHGVWNPYDSHIPLLWYGWKIPKGSSAAQVYLTDIAATVSALLHIQMPNGSIGHSLVPMMRK